MSIPQGAKPQSVNQFMKFKEGSNRFRVLSDVVFGWEGWKDSKPFRHAGQECKIKPSQVDYDEKYKKPKINFFWAMVVWNYQEKKVQVLEITQKKIQGSLWDYEQDVEWGDIKNYDIDVVRKEESGKTEYLTKAMPPKELSKEIKQIYEETDVKLEKLFEGGYTMPVDEEVIPEGDNSF